MAESFVSTAKTTTITTTTKQVIIAPFLRPRFLVALFVPCPIFSTCKPQAPFLKANRSEARVFRYALQHLSILEVRNDKVAGKCFTAAFKLFATIALTNVFQFVAATVSTSTPTREMIRTKLFKDLATGLTIKRINKAVDQ